MGGQLIGTVWGDFDVGTTKCKPCKYGKFAVNKLNKFICGSVSYTMLHAVARTGITL